MSFYLRYWIEQMEREMKNPAVKPPLITVLKWDSDQEKEVVAFMTQDQIVENPNGVNLTLFGLYVINALRNARGLEPIPEDLDRLTGKSKSL